MYIILVTMVTIIGLSEMGIGSISGCHHDKYNYENIS
jgi:hypothetical protein